MGELRDDAVVRRTLDRFGFGADAQALARARSAGPAATLEALLRPLGSDRGSASTPPPELPRLARPRAESGEKPDRADKRAWRQQRRAQAQQLTVWWLDRMVCADHQATERLTWFWHGHFATSNQKVKDARLMLGQNATIRRLALGDFRTLAQALLVDPAMLVWLDGNDNTAQAPNENLSRESLELFLLGHGRYAESDVREAARALAGWKVDRATGSATVRPRRRDATDKTILGVTRNFDASSFVSLVVGRPASADFLVSRVWARLVSATPPVAATRARLAAAYGPDRDMAGLLAAVAAESAFCDADSSLVKQPVEWTVGLMRALAVRPTALRPTEQKRLLATLRGMGQVPFLPPSVGGWPAGAAWLTTAAALSRVEAARLIATQARPDAETARTSPKNRVEAVRRLLGVDRFSTRTRNAIDQVAHQLPAAIAVAACSPEYVVSG